MKAKELIAVLSQDPEAEVIVRYVDLNGIDATKSTTIAAKGIYAKENALVYADEDQAYDDYMYNKDDLVDAIVIDVAK